ncbi:MAG: hypothetical protein V1719_00585 [Patescibacteria group bacterium]
MTNLTKDQEVNIAKKIAQSGHILEVELWNQLQELKAKMRKRDEELILEHHVVYLDREYSCSKEVDLRAEFRVGDDMLRSNCKVSFLIEVYRPQPTNVVFLYNQPSTAFVDKIMGNLPIWGEFDLNNNLKGYVKNQPRFVSYEVYNVDTHGEKRDLGNAPIYERIQKLRNAILTQRIRDGQEADFYGTIYVPVVAVDASLYNVLEDGEKSEITGAFIIYKYANSSNQVTALPFYIVSAGSLTEHLEKIVKAVTLIT